MAYARFEARMGAPVKTGGTVRTNLEAAAKAGHPSARMELAGPELPLGLEHVWAWWCELNAGRRVGFDGPAPLAYADIDAWARLTSRTPEPHEIRLLMAVDRAMRHPDGKD